jgi:hypothetical protein
MSKQREYQLSLVTEFEALAAKIRAREIRVHIDHVLMTADEKKEYDHWLVRRRQLLDAMGQEFLELWYSTVGVRNKS